MFLMLPLQLKLDSVHENRGIFRCESGPFATAESFVSDTEAVDKSPRIVRTRVFSMLTSLYMEISGLSSVSTN